MSTLLVDFRCAWRTLGRTPRFTALVVFTLAFGIAANTSIFSVVYAVMLRPLPYPQPQQLVRITSELRAFGADDTGVAPPELFDYQARTDLFSGVAGLYPINANLTGGDQPERVEVMLVSWNYFSVLGAPPALGRVFGPDDNGPGIPEIAVVSDGYWRRRLGADPQAIGRTLMVDGDPFVLVGVMPPGFRHPGRTVQTEVDLWAPAGYRSMPFNEPQRGGRFLEGALARLQPGVTVGQARAALALYGEAATAEYPNDYPVENGWAPRLVPLQDDLTRNVAATMWILLSAVGLVLLIACANVANLILARSAERQQEMAMRRALGASHAQLARQMLTESSLLAGAAGVVGLLMAGFGIDALVALAPGRIARLGPVSLDAPAVAIAVVVSAAITIVFGLVPVWHHRRLAPYAVVKESAAGGSSPRHVQARYALVAAEVALAMVLLVGTGLLARTVAALINVPVGFDSHHLLTARVWLPRPNDSAQAVYLRPEARVNFYREAIRRVKALPGVEQAAMSTQVPMGGYNPPIFFEIEGRTADRDRRPVIHNFQVSPGYFETMRIPVVRGRGFTEFDRAGSEPVAMVSAAAARQYWADADPVGARIRFAPTAPWLTIVGIAGDVQNRRLDEPAQPIVYRTLEQSSNLALALLVRADGDRLDLGDAIAREVRAVDPNLPVYSVRLMDDLLAGAVAERQFLMRLVTVFGAAAIGLALLGLYAVISYSVAQRTREIGVRVALGARQGDVAALVLRQGLGVTAVGMAAGVAAALVLARLVQSQFFGVRPSDPATLAVAVAVMGVTALGAVYLPARRAMRVDPIRALRAER